MLVFKNYFSTDFCASEEKLEEIIFEKMLSEKDSGEIGYYTLHESQKETIKEIEEFKKSNIPYSKSLIKNVIVIGIGGSSLGAKAVDNMLCSLENRNEIELIFLENCDPVNLDRELEGIEAKESLVITISKSGGTIETLSLTKYILERFDLKFGSEEIKNHFVVITEEGSPLEQFAKENNIKAFFLPKNVGGRFSVFSAVGLLPLSLVGYDVEKILDGQKEICSRFFAKELPELMKKAHFYTKYAHKYSINVLFSYSSTLRELNSWYVQLWGESLGKINAQESRVGLTPIGLVGSVDQHSFLQLIVQGPEDKSVTFLKIKDFKNNKTIPNITIPKLEKTDYVNTKMMQELLNAQCDATAETLIEQGVPVDVMEIDCLSEKSCGELIYYFELLTSCSGAFLGVNTYDQPGVEFGKKRLVEKFS